MQASPAWAAGQAVVALRAAAAGPTSPRPGAAGTCRTRRSTGRASRAAPYAGQVWAIEVELTPKRVGRTGRIITELLTAMQYAQVVYLTAPAARPLVTRVAAGLAARGTGPGDGPGAAARRVHGGAAAMSAWSWLKLTVCLWLLRKAVRIVRWLLLVVAAARGVAGDAGRGGRVRGGVAARLAGGPAAPDRRLGPAGHGVSGCSSWRSATPGWRPVAADRGPGVGAGGLHHLAGAGLARDVRCCSSRSRCRPGWRWPRLAWAWRILRRHRRAGRHGRPPRRSRFDARQWRRQVRTAKGLIKAPGAVPLLARGEQIPVGGDHPDRRAPLAAGVRAAGGRVRPAHGRSSARPGRARRT